MPRSNSDALKFTIDEPQAETRRCEWPDCAGTGDFRAPKSRDRLTEYHWFCLDHVREYNRAWNYFANMNEEEIEAYRRADTTWHRPTWRFGSIGGGRSAGERTEENGNGRSHFRHEEETFHDPFGFFDEGKRQSRREREAAANRAKGPEEKALATFDLAPGASFDTVKQRYRELAKKLHPDANGGDRDSEERLKVINQAYTTLKAFYATPA